MVEIPTKSICPRCKSDNIRIVDYMTVQCIVCNSCGYDERMVYEIVPEEKTSQKLKGRFSPYKAGGASRIVKK
ncbi:hypothetical protein HYS48_02390 [Candidatus Woesearchaeota archaeon]|nr:hypothetical protein [Candidatus Woesearchaeota archaeon]